MNVDVRCKRKYNLRNVKTVIGIDPGVTGAVAVIRGDAQCYQIQCVYDLPIKIEKKASGKIRRSIDALAFQRMIEALNKEYSIDQIICEALIPAPRSGSMQSFSMGMAQGTLTTILHLSKIPFFLVYPAKWKQSLSIPSDKIGSLKKATRIFKEDTHWKRKRDHNRAEAALLSLYGLLI